MLINCITAQHGNVLCLVVSRGFARHFNGAGTDCHTPSEMNISAAVKYRIDDILSYRWNYCLQTNAQYWRFWVLPEMEPWNSCFTLAFCRNCAQNSQNIAACGSKSLCFRKILGYHDLWIWVCPRRYTQSHYLTKHVFKMSFNVVNRPHFIIILALTSTD